MVTNQRVWSGWTAFAAVMMIIVGLVNVLEGIVTIIYPGRTVVVADQLYVVDVRTWGILILAFGAILTCAGIGVLSAQAWARVAIVFVSLHAVVQVGWLAAYPLWSLLMLGLDVAVLYALTARWRQTATARDEYTSSTSYDPRDRQDIWEQHPRTVA